MPCPRSTCGESAPTTRSSASHARSGGALLCRCISAIGSQSCSGQATLHRRYHVVDQEIVKHRIDARPPTTRKPISACASATLASASFTSVVSRYRISSLAARPRSRKRSHCGRNRKLFEKRHRDTPLRRHLPAQSRPLKARMSGCYKGRILFIDDRIPFSESRRRVSAHQSHAPSDPCGRMVHHILSIASSRRRVEQGLRSAAA
jgi:hypothetical protein